MSSKPKKISGKLAIIIAAVVLLLLAVGTTAAGLYVKNIETIYPNVTVSGIDVSDMTVAQATQVLTNAGYGANASNVSVTVLFPDEETMTISGEESGVMLVASTAADIAYSYGRDGSFFKNELSYIRSLFTSHELDQSGAARINEEYVRSIIDDFVTAFNEKITNDAFTISVDSIKIVKGSAGTLADTDALYPIVEAALDQSAAQDEPVSVEYNVGTDGGTDIDLHDIYDSIFIEPISAVFDDETYQVTRSVTGVSFDISAAQHTLDSGNIGATITIPLIKTEPKITTDALESLIFRDVLSEQKTYVSGTSNRKHNVMLSTEAINGTILNPGDVFSYNETLGQRTAEKGYRTAGAYVGGQVVQEIGGGICQASSTLYSSVLYADLEVVDRSNHMFIVTYLPLGNDATVNWGTVDFKFRNDTDYPIKIDAIYEDAYLTISLNGTKFDSNYVKIDRVVISSTPFETVQEEDPSIEEGTTKTENSGHTGYVVDTYKYFYDENDNLLDTLFVSRSKYRTQDKLVLVPVGTLTSPEPSESPSPSGSETPSPSASESPSPSASESPSPSTSESPSPSASESPSPSASESPSPSASETPSPSPSPTTTPSETPETSA